MDKSGLDSLLDALRASGADVDGKFGDKGGSGSTSGSAGTSGSKSEGSSTSKQASGSSKSSSKSSSSSSSSKGEKQSGGFADIPDAVKNLKVTEKVKGLQKRGKIIFGIIIVLILGILYWWFHPPISIHSETTWAIGLVLIALPMFLFFRSRLSKYQEEGASKTSKTSKFFDKVTGKSGESSSSEKKDSKINSSSKKNSEDFKKEVKGSTNAEKAKLYKKLCWIPIALLLLCVLGALLSASFFPGNAEKYASVLKTQDLDFKQDIKEVNYSQIPVIDRETAIVLGNKEMGTIPDYVSQFEISNIYSQINFNQKPVRVSPLGYADLFKWLTNRDAGIPAYCIIDMATQDAKIVRVSDVDGTENQGIKYSESEPLARNIERYIQLKYPFYIFDEFSFEVDDDGHPWWICPVQTRTIGLFGGKTIAGVVMCDAVTGECQDLDIEDVPQWVDRAYPSELLIEQYNWSGMYSKGWLNSWLGQSGVVKTTPGSHSSDGNSSSATSSSAKSLGYNYIAKDDDVWVYTGVTSATSDSSIVGFILINQRTAESHFYSISGATEAAAMQSAEGQVQNLRYTSTFPILINVSNQPTYFMSLKDSAGLVKKYAMIDIQRYQNVAIGDTVAECQKSYQTLLTRIGVLVGDGQFTTGGTATGTIATMASAVVDGNSHYYITLTGDNKIYDCALPGLIKIVTHKVGDQVTLKYSEGDKTQTVISIE